MTQYEEILNKIAPIFYKFINYRKYFDINTASQFSYLKNAGLSYDTIYSPCEIPIRKAPTYFLGIDRAGARFSPTITLYEGHRIGKYVGVTHEEAVVDLVLNKFSFEKSSVVRPYFFRRSPYSYSLNTFKELFIAAVGKDTYETIRNNIK